MDNMTLSPMCGKYLKKYYEKADEILCNSGYRKLSSFPRHRYTNTMDHSIRVACVNLYLSERFHVAPESAIKTGLLHDFCLVNYYEEHHLPVSKRHKGIYAFYHPAEAAENAEKITELTREEIRAIQSHMFPLSVHIPTSRLGWMLTISDKIVAVYESFYGLRIFHSLMMREGKKAVEKEEMLIAA